jgi:hypothetical protein
MPQKTDLDHFMQLRMSRATVAQIDAATATTPELSGFSRCRFIRFAVGFALASLHKEPGADVEMEKRA